MPEQDVKRSAAESGVNVPLAHIGSDGQQVQTLVEHLTGTSRLAKNFGHSFQADELAEIIGLLHDIGKFSQKFQTYLKEGGWRGQEDHSTAGAKYVSQYMGLLAFCIAGHHAGLPSLGSQADVEGATLFARLNKNISEYMPGFTANMDFKFNKPDMLKHSKRMSDDFSRMLFVRLLFSCLVDADFLDTEAFMQDMAGIRGDFDDIAVLKQRLDEKIAEFEPPANAINEKRCAILRNCINLAVSEKPGLFSLTVPTGGGKTIASLAFALHHACQHGMKRIIYVIPYTSIIEQNAKVFADIVGADNVVEHHMNAEYDVGELVSVEQSLRRKRLAAENWDAPIIVTTNVQFFESLFSYKPSKCRKLHNIAGSVIIFDEAQMLPTDFLLPCVKVIDNLVSQYDCTAVLCTATQPSLNKFFAGAEQTGFMIRELCPEIQAMFDFFKRVNIVWRNRSEINALASELKQQEQVLCIVNKKRTAQELYDAIKAAPGSYHLSTYLCPKHRQAKLAAIREDLQKGRSCRVISTSLIEAGVDVDFPVVYRETAGLDSIIQAAGRCNREGRRAAADSPVYIFDLEEEQGSNWLSRQRELTKSVARKFADISSIQAIQSYFNQLHTLSGDELDRKKILHRIEDEKFPFREIGNAFVLIDEPTKAIFIPYDDTARLLADKLRYGKYSRQLMRQVGYYIVNVYSSGQAAQPGDFEKLAEAGKLEMLDDNISILLDMNMCDESKGLVIDSKLSDILIM